MNHPAGFGASDSLLFTLAVLFCLLVASAAWLETPLRAFAKKRGWCLLLLACLPVLLRLALLRHHPVPTPNTADDFSYLLLADTLAHFRLANATHPMHRFFEAVFVLQQPSYSSIFPLGQGIVLAAGQVIFRHAWAGVVISIGALCALSYWMLRAWVTPFWALLGALLGVCEFGPLSSWMNTYWGGAVSAIAGCLTFGAMVRLRQSRKTAGCGSVRTRARTGSAHTSLRSHPACVVRAALFRGHARWPRRLDENGVKVSRRICRHDSGTCTDACTEPCGIGVVDDAALRRSARCNTVCPRRSYFNPTPNHIVT